MKNEVISIPIKRVNMETYDQYDLTKVSFNLLSEGAVQSHGLYMEKGSLDSISESINLKPILCAYETNEEGDKTDFKGHEIEYQILKDGEKTTIKTVYIEQPVGVLEDSNFKVEEIDGVNWVSCDGYLYNEYCNDAVRILDESNGEKSVSIEFKILDGFEDDDDKLYHVTKIHFLGVTLLGESHNPAITGASITKFTEKHNALFTEQFEKIVESVNRYKQNEGGERMKREDLIKKYEHLKGVDQFELIISNESVSLEELKTQLFALSNRQIEKAVREALRDKTITKDYGYGDCYEMQKYYYEDMIQEDNIAICEDNENYYAYYGIPFTMQGDKAILEYDKAERYVRGDWRKYQGDIAEIPVNPSVVAETKAIIENLECKIKENETLSNELISIKANFTDVKGELENSKVELERLKKFEEDVLKKEYENKIQEVICEFEELKDIEGFEQIVSDNSKGDIEELRKSLKVFAFDNGVVIKKGKKKSFSTKEPQLIKTNNSTVEVELSEAEKRYGTSIKKYIDNY